MKTNVISPVEFSAAAQVAQCIVEDAYLTARKRVLVVEDNPVTQLVMLQQLKMLGFEPRAASSGSEAIEMLSYESVDLVLMDCRLPELSGYDTTRAIRVKEMFYSLKPVAIVAITGESDIECVDRCFAAGMDGHLAKPVKIGVLSTLLKHFIK